MTVARAADRLGEELLPHVPMSAAPLYMELDEIASLNDACGGAG